MRKTMKGPLVSIVVPVFNESSILAENAVRLCQYLDRIGNYELLIGSNGSRAGVTLEAEAPRSSESLDVTAVGPGDRPACGIDSDSLAIPDYESLSASQVVPRLESLTDDELESIRQYEAANRARRTILSKIAQLQAQ